MCPTPAVPGPESTNSVLLAILDELKGIKANQAIFEQKVRVLCKEVFWGRC